MFTFKTKGLENFSIEGDINEVKRGLKELSAVYGKETVQDLVEDGLLINDGIDMLLDLDITKEDVNKCVRWGDYFDDDEIQELELMTSVFDLLLDLKGTLWAYEQLSFMRFLLASCGVEIAVKDGHFGTEIEISFLFD